MNTIEHSASEGLLTAERKLGYIEKIERIKTLGISERAIRQVVSRAELANATRKQERTAAILDAAADAKTYRDSITTESKT